MEDELKAKLNKNYEKISIKKESFKKKDKNIQTKLRNFINQNIAKFNNKNEKAIKIINENEKQIIKKTRNPGVDLVRLIAMYGAIINHLLYVHGGVRKYPQYSKYLKILHILTGWHNDGFALISGIVGYKSFRYANLLYLWLYVVFYTLGIPYYFKHFKKIRNINTFYIKDYFPIIFKRYWYFTAYFGMSLYLPLVNKGISIITRYEFTLVVITTIWLFSIWRATQNPGEDVFSMSYGMTMVWIFTFYITGAYIGKYKVEYHGFKKYIFCIICAFIFSYSNYIFFKVINNELNLKGYYGRKLLTFLQNNFLDRYDGLLKIMTSITASLFFMQIHYNKYIGKFIGMLGPLAFSIYIIHENHYVKKYILFHTFNREPDNISLKSAMILISLKGFKILLFCLIIDFFRNLLFKIFQIKRICIFLEDSIKKLFS